MGSNERGSEDGGGGVGEGDESRSRGEEERQQVVVGCSTDSVSHGVLLPPYFRRCLFRAQVSLQGCPGSCVPWCAARLPRHSPHSSLSPSHVEACPAEHCVNVIRPAKPVSPLLFLFSLFLTRPVLFTCSLCSPPLAVNRAHLRLCVMVCVCVSVCAV